MAYKKPKDYDSVKVGESRILPAGGYICRILKAEETESRAGKPMIKVAFDIEGGEYKFRVKTNGADCVKSPLGMFETDSIDNDLKYVDKTIREYYGMTIPYEEEK